MTCQELAQEWYKVWDSGEFERLPISPDFQHTSPYGTISGKETYFELVRANTEKFIGNKITIRDQVFHSSYGCTRYSLENPEFRMEVTEWFYSKGNMITKVVAYYHVGETIDESRQLRSSD